MPFLDQGVVDRHPGIVDHAVHHSERVGLRYPAVIVDRTRSVAALWSGGTSSGSDRKRA
jgi:hypothetical protein